MSSIQHKGRSTEGDAEGNRWGNWKGYRPKTAVLSGPVIPTYGGTGPGTKSGGSPYGPCATSKECRCWKDIDGAVG